jgi:IS5 family transposase
MPPKSSPPVQPELFRSALVNLVDPKHPLVRLAGLIDWERFRTAFGPLSRDGVGRPGLPTRLMVGLHLIKHMDGLSDEAVCARFLDSPSVQLFCGESHVQHALPLDRSSMTCWRQRNCAERLELLLAETLAATNRPVAGGTVVLGARTLPGNPCDGQTLAAQIAQTERITGVTSERASVDRGDRGHDAEDRRSGETRQSRVFLSGQKRGVTPTIRREIRRRAGIEPAIGQRKADGHLGRNVLAGAAGDAITLVLAATGHTLRLLRTWLIRLLAFLLSHLVIGATAPPQHSPRLARR